MGFQKRVSAAAGRAPRSRLPMPVCLAIAAVLAASALAAEPAAGQVPPSRLRAIDIYRTSQLDEAALERRLEPAIGELVAAINANDEAAIERTVGAIMGSIETSGDFAHLDFSLTTSFENDANVIDVTIELVDAADAETRLAFNPAPTGSVEDPDGVLAAWNDYQTTAYELVNTRQMEATQANTECPALHCAFGFNHEMLTPFLADFDRAAREHREALLRVLREDADAGKRSDAVFVLAHSADAGRLVRDLTPSLDDPASGVRNNVMRVMSAIARADDTIRIPFAPLARRIDDPSGACRNKAAYLIAALADRPEYRDEILAIMPDVMRLLRLDKPNNHNPAYQVLTTISGETFGDRDYEHWEAWIARNAVTTRGGVE